MRSITIVGILARSASDGERQFSSCRVANARRTYLGASEATIFSKRGSPRTGSQSGCRRSSPHLSDYAFAPYMRKQNGFPVAPIARQRSQGAKRGIEIAIV